MIFIRDPQPARVTVRQIEAGSNLRLKIWVDSDGASDVTGSACDSEPLRLRLAHCESDRYRRRPLSLPVPSGACESAGHGPPRLGDPGPLRRAASVTSVPARPRGVRGCHCPAARGPGPELTEST